MITFVTHMRVSAENAAAIDTILSEMRERVRAQEPGVAYYDFVKDAKDPNIYVVIEVYRDEAGFFAHGKTNYIRDLLPKSAVLVEGGKFDIKQYVSPGMRPVRALLPQDGVGQERET
jgi:quinol monooxygenase YgiN